VDDSNHMIDRSRLEKIVRAAGAMALARWPGHGHSPESWEKGPGDRVSEADLAVDAFLKRELGALLPAADWLSEETADAPDRLGHDGAGRGLLWLVDPIDGTRDFLRGRTGWAVSVALVNAGRPLFGMLSAPARNQAQGGEFWYGESGQGAWRNGERLVASTRTNLAGARVPALQLPAADVDLAMVEQPNSIALRMAMVAAAEADLVATLRWGYEWDIAAAALIAREAGAAVTDAFGAPLNYNKPDPRDFGLLVSAPAIHTAAVARLADRARDIAG
jgi:myo-inositol-1(or 4)-monophosphatase